MRNTLALIICFLVLSTSTLSQELALLTEPISKISYIEESFKIDSYMSFKDRHKIVWRKARETKSHVSFVLPKTLLQIAALEGLVLQRSIDQRNYANQEAYNYVALLSVNRSLNRKGANWLPPRVPDHDEKRKSIDYISVCFSSLLTLIPFFIKK